MNAMPTFDRKQFFIALLFLVLIVLLAGGMGGYVLSDPGISHAFLLAKAAAQIERVCGDSISHAELVASAREGMFAMLDRYSFYVDSARLHQLDEELSGHYGGIGVVVVRHELGLLVMSVREGGPAAEVGVLPGDIILAADSVEFQDIPLDSTTSLLRGKEGTKVLVRILRASVGDTVEVTITRRQISLFHIPYAGIIAPGIGYIRLLDFEAGASAEVEAAMDSLSAQENLTGLILDLRGNPGGLFSEAIGVANLFLEEGTFIVGTDARSRWDERRYYAEGPDILKGKPLLVLVDRGSASSAEIVAGALREAGRAHLVGDTTFGKGLVQTYLRFPDGDGIRLTFARYYFDDTVFLNDFDSTLHDVGHGLVPDYFFAFPEKAPFPRTLENSLVLQQFGNKYQKQIVEAVENDSFDERWLRRFIAFARDEGFAYRSFTTDIADVLAEVTADEARTSALKSLTRKILHAARKDDERQFYKYRDYILSRLKQIAYERTYGTFRMYDEVIVKEQPVICYARRLLMEKK